MRIAIGCDHAGFPLKASLVSALEGAGHAVLDLGTFSEDPVDYPDFARSVGHAVIRGFVDVGLLVCGSGVGAVVAANKIRGIRAVTCADADTARQSREYVDANVLCLAARSLDQAQAQEITRAWLGAGFSGDERHARRLAKISQLETELPPAGKEPLASSSGPSVAERSAPTPPITPQRAAPVAPTPLMRTGRQLTEPVTSGGAAVKAERAGIRARGAEPPGGERAPGEVGGVTAPPPPPSAPPDTAMPGEVEQESLSARASRLIEQALGKLGQEVMPTPREGVISLDEADLAAAASPPVQERPTGSAARRADPAPRSREPQPIPRTDDAALPARPEPPIAPPPPPLPDPVALAPVQQALRAVDELGFLDRIWMKDGTLWKGDPEFNRNRLGWLTSPTILREQAGELKAFADEIRRLQFTQVLLLGMGGSSVAAEVFATTFGSRIGYPDLLVLDSTDPAAVKQTLNRLDLGHTLFVVSTKSGATAETLALYAFFRGEVEASRPPKPGMQFLAITDPGSPLEQLAQEAGFRRTFLNPTSIGGRYSALSFFGLVPAALIGVDVKTLLERADAMVQACTGELSAQENAGARLGAALVALARQGRDKVTLTLSPGIRAFGAWAEQLLAESLGKDGTGVVPVDAEPLAALEAYGDDRVFVATVLGGDAATDATLARLAAAGHPVIRIGLKDPLDLGAEFFRWELATAAAGAMLGVNPFDEPDVASAKERTGALLSSWKKSKKLDEWPVDCEEDGLALMTGSASPAASVADGLRAHLDSAGPGHYIGIQAYLAPTAETAARLNELRALLRDRRRVATTLGYGPRYLHSTGQLHKGGPNTGVFLQLTADDREDLSIPGAGYGFSTLKAAQALGDLQALRDAGRRIVRVHFRGKLGPALDQLLRCMRRVTAEA